MIDLRCPQALEDPNPGGSEGKGVDVDPAEVEVNVDVIDSRTFAELDRFVREKVAISVQGTSVRGGSSAGSDDGDSMIPISALAANKRRKR